MTYYKDMSSNYGFQPTLSGLNTIESDSTTSSNIICDTIQINQSGTAPTMTPNDNSTHIATTAYVDSAISGSGFVTLSGTQTISGQKTFTAANTYVTGNVVCNNYISDNSGSNINIGTNLFTGDIILGNPTGTAGQNTALNWGTTSNSGQLTFRGGSFTLSSSGNYTQQSGSTLTTTIDNNKTTGAFNMLTGTTWSGNCNIGTGVGASGNIIIGGANTKTYLSGNVFGDPTTGILNLNTTTSSSLNIAPTQLTGTINIGANKTGGSINIASGTNFTGVVNIANNTTTFGGVNMGSANSSSSTFNFDGAYVNINSGYFLTGYPNYIQFGSGAPLTHFNVLADTSFNGSTTFDGNNDFPSACPTTPIAPTTGDMLCNKTYVDSVASGTALLSSNNTWTGSNTFQNFSVSQNGGTDISMSINTVGSDNFYFNFATSAALRMHYINALNRVNIDVPTAGKKLSLGLAGTEYLRLDASLSGGAGVLVNKLTTGAMDIVANNINQPIGGVDLTMSLGGTNYLTLQASTSKVVLAPTRCASYLEVVGEIQANNPIEVTYNPSSISAGRIGYQNITAVSTIPVSNTSTWTNVQSVSLSAGVWNIEGTSYYATNVVNAFRGISLTTTSGSYDTSRWIRTQSSGGDFFSNRVTSIFSLTATTTVYLTGYASAGSITGSAHTIRYTRIA